ncbi:MAG: 4Fe-4S binding protein [Anaerolineaceae bacterium]|nr:4Fe-4S binding protein [Anaerolineaceae bacterium]
MGARGLTHKTKTEHKIILERPVVTRHYVMTWNLDYCVGCEIGPLACPKDAILHIDGQIEDGRLARKPTIDIDPEKCVMCGICEVMCPKNAISMTINDKPENPALEYGAFPELIQSTVFDKDEFNWDLKDFVIENCPTQVISYDEEEKTLLVNDPHCIRCRQCEIASEGAFTVQQPWQGKVELHRDLCVEGCTACADICPTRALHVNEDGELVLADYFCIKCGACMQVCPVKREYDESEITFQSYGVEVKRQQKTVNNQEKLPIWVERWRIGHEAVESGSWIDALRKLADDKAGMIELDKKRALKRRDLLKALPGSRILLDK